MRTVKVRISGYYQGLPKLDEYMYDELTKAGWKSNKAVMIEEDEEGDTVLSFVEFDETDPPFVFDSQPPVNPIIELTKRIEALEEKLAKGKVVT